MYKEPRDMKELHEIRERHYNNTKNMSDKEFIEDIHREAKEAMEKFGLKFKVKERQLKYG